MTFGSRHLGEFELVGGTQLDTSIPIADRTVPFRLEIDFPETFGPDVIDMIDNALDGVDDLDRMARDTIAAGLRIDTSAPSQLLRAHPDLEPADFLARLQPEQFVMLPDGGRHSSERVRMTYALADATVRGPLTVRFHEPIGPELDPAPRAGY